MGVLERVRDARVGGREDVPRWRDNAPLELADLVVVRILHATAPVDVVLSSSGDELVQDMLHTTSVSTS